MREKILVVGLGNPILGDDAVGLRVAQALKDRVAPGIEVVEASIAGLDFLELLSGVDRAIIIDAIQTEGGRPGEIYRLEPGSFRATRHATTPHDVNFATALELGRRLSLPIPKSIVIFGIEACQVDTLSEECTPEVEEAVPRCVEMVIKELGDMADEADGK